MKRKFNYTSILAVAATIATLLSTSPAVANDADDRIETSFKESYVYRTYLKDDSVKSSAKDGVVTLTGTVAEESHKTLAQETAEGLTGVTRVDNQLETNAEVAADNSDTWITRKVRLTLLLHRHVNSSKTTIDVKDGVVTLTGVASSLAQKELTGEYAADIENVVKVENMLTVSDVPDAEVRSAGEKLDDASVTAQVKSSLLVHRSTSALKTKVETRDGVVTLTGIAKNSAERSLVTKAVSDVKGVSSVNNEMTIAVSTTK
ncbi:BON domain-containing protein [bacterium]|nr:BON domain-containing protein [bacterium]